MTKKSKKVLVLIDSNALIHRAFHALPPLTKKDGTPSGAVYGYAMTLLSVMEKLKPDYIAATFDLAGPTFRHEKYEEYKATRTKAPDELYEQIPIVKEMLKSYGVPIFEEQGFEADDVIGTLAKDKSLDGDLQKIIVTGDMDALQLVDDSVSVFTLRKGIKDTVTYDEKAVKKRFDLTPAQIVDYKSLRGDASDNIPGVKGVGEKTAVKLLKEFGDLEGVYENLEKVKPDSLKKKLEDEKEKAFLSYELAEIKTDMKIDFDLEKTKTEKLSQDNLAEFFKEMEFFSLYKKFASEEVQGAQEQKNEIELKELKDKKQIASLAKKISEKKKVSIQFVQNSNSENGWQCVGLALSVDGKEGFYASLEDAEPLFELIGKNEILKIGFDVKKDLLLTKEKKEEFFDNFFDVQIAAYLLNAGGNLELGKLIFEQFGASLKEEESGKRQASLLAGLDQSVMKGAAEKAVWSYRLFENYQKQIEEISAEQKKAGAGKTLKWLFDELEMPTIPLLAKMQWFGIKVEKSALQEVSQKTAEKLEKLEEKIFELAGEKFNINSPSQLAPILYEKLKISTAEVRRGKTGFSTNADQLRKIKHLHPIVSEIEKYRELFKIKTTYADALPQLVWDDGRIHSSFNQAVAATGRLSSSDPNMQNIPKKGDLANAIRSAFVADEGKVFVSADYSQIDLRVAAHLSDDPKLKDAFLKGEDIHSATAAWVEGISPEKITKKQRGQAKSLNFGVLYGMGLYGFMRDSGVSYERAAGFLKRYMETFSKLKQYIEETKKSARENGYIETEMGRRRYVPNINASNSMMRSAAERVAVNLPVQGLAADIMKLAMIKVDENVLEKYNKKKEAVKPILQIHDELVFEVEKEVASEFAKDLKVEMEKVYELKVPLVVDVSQGGNWSEL